MALDFRESGDRYPRGPRCMPQSVWQNCHSFRSSGGLALAERAQRWWRRCCARRPLKGTLPLATSAVQRRRGLELSRSAHHWYVWRRHRQPLLKALEGNCDAEEVTLVLHACRVPMACRSFSALATPDCSNRSDLVMNAEHFAVP